MEAFSTEAVRAARTRPLPTARTLPCWTVVRPGPGPGSGREASKSSSRSLRSVSPQTYITARMGVEERTAAGTRAPEQVMRVRLRRLV